jgi:hypothetical protein
MKRIVKLLPILLLFTSFSYSNPTLQDVYNELENQNIKHADIVLRQVIEETGWLECENCSRTKNNLFGMTKSVIIDGKRKRVYVRYNNWKQSITAYKKWQLKWYKDDKLNYYQFLNCIYTTKTGRCVRYATNEKYTDNLKNFNIDEIFK